VGKRGRDRQRLRAPSSDYSDPHGNTLTLRGSLTPAARREYAQTLAGTRGRASDTREDAWQRAVELLFERLDRQRELLARLRAADAEQRAWVRASLREHCAEHFPDVDAP